MNILIVDDNVLVLEGFTAGVDVENLGFSEVYTATSITEAKRIIQKEPIHAVIADIEMPGGSGLELLEWINEFDPLIVTVFCTSYGDFNYAKKAVELHAFDYFLKPIDYRKLTDKLRDVVEEVKKRRTQEELTEYGKVWLEQRGKNTEAFWLQILCSGIEYADIELEQIARDWKTEYTDKSEFSLLYINFYAMGKKQKELSSSMNAFILRNIVEDTFRKDTETVSVEIVLKRGENSWLVILHHNSEGMYEESSLIESCEAFIKSYRNVAGSILNVCYVWRVPFLQIMRDYHELDETDERLGDESKGKAVPFSAIQKQIHRNNDSGKGQNIVQKVMTYIDQQYGEMITREQLGIVACLNPTYLARIFKTETGKSMGNYILDERIKKAKLLLETSEMTISEVAQAVGYDNFSYFSKLFKDRTGMTPKEYRKGEE